MGLAETRGVQAASGNAMCCNCQRVRDLRVVFLLDWTGHTRFEHAIHAPACVASRGVPAVSIERAEAA